MGVTSQTTPWAIAQTGGAWRVELLHARHLRRFYRPRRQASPNEMSQIRGLRAGW
jgi:hypothetical protein